MLQAVLWAGERFVMLELGAGFGRWGIWGAMAAKAVGINDICVRLVEAEPQHSSWAAESIRLNGLEREVTLIEGAISNALEPVPFFIDVPAEALQATSWWGQSVNRPNEPTKLSGETYFGYPVYRNDYCGQIYVPPITIERAIEGLDLVDLIDVDLQEAEIELLDWMDLLTAKVRMIHFGTHRLDIEKALREAFQRWGWICQWDFSLLGERETPFGLIGFEDGVQTWINPNLPGANDKVLMRQLQQELSALQATATGTAARGGRRRGARSSSISTMPGASPRPTPPSPTVPVFKDAHLPGADRIASEIEQRIG